MIKTSHLIDILRRHELPRAPSIGIFKPASVLMPLFDKGGEAHLLAVLKADTEGYPWRNQVALPGGLVDDDDDNTMATACREIEEELSINRSQVEMVGSLGWFQTIRETEIEAFVGLWDGERAGLCYDPGEISEILEIRLEDLVSAHVAGNYQGRRPGVANLIYPAGRERDDNIVIWGVTAMIVHFFLEHLRLMSPESFYFVSKKRLFI